MSETKCPECKREVEHRANSIIVMCRCGNYIELKEGEVKDESQS